MVSLNAVPSEMEDAAMLPVTVYTVSAHIAMVHGQVLSLKTPLTGTRFRQVSGRHELHLGRHSPD